MELYLLNRVKSFATVLIIKLIAPINREHVNDCIYS